MSGSVALQDMVKGSASMGEWLSVHVLHMAGLQQGLACLVAVGLGFLGTHLLRSTLVRSMEGRPVVKEWLERALQAVLVPLISLLFLMIFINVARRSGWPLEVLELGKAIAEAWLVIQFFTALLLPPGWTKPVMGVVVCLFGLEVLGILDSLISYLDGVALSFDNERVSMLEICKAMILLAVMLPLINKLSSLVDVGLSRLGEVNSRVRVLIVKLTRTGLYIVAFVAALDLVGINLQMLTVFGGAVGLGLGFGLQKVVSNLVSGVILLLDNSIKPGDVIEIGGVYGWIEGMNARYASMHTRDGKAILIPNDELIGERVVNWSFSGPGVRLKIPVGVAYGTDLNLAMELMRKAAEGKDRVLPAPKPNALLMGFGENGLNLELRVWITHPEKGVARVSSAVQLAIWELFTQNGIEFPFPQQDVHIKDGKPLKVEVEYLPLPKEGEEE